MKLMPTKTEYKVVRSTDDKMESTLNTLAADGWRVVSVTSPFEWTLVAVLERRN
jgi:hypothetical protein